MSNYDVKVHGVLVRTVGQQFGCVGVVYNDCRERVAETDVIPYGMQHVARARAEEMAARLHYPAGLSYWSVFEKRWCRVLTRDQVPVRDLTALSDAEREMIARLPATVAARAS